MIEEPPVTSQPGEGLAELGRPQHGVNGITSERVAIVALLAFALFLPRIAAAQIAYATALLAWLLGSRGGEAHRLRSYALLPLGIFAALTTLSCVFSVSPIGSAPRLREIALYGIPLVSVRFVDTRRKLEAIVHALFASSAVLAVWGIVQFQVWSGGIERRIRGPMSHWMTYSGLLTLTAALAMAYATYHQNRRARLGYALLTLLLSAAIALTLTRGAYLAMLVGVSLLLLLRKPLLLAFLPLPLILGLLVVPSQVVSRLLTLQKLTEDPTTVDRVQLWKSGLLMIRDHPILGVGLNMVPAEYQRYRDPAAPKKRTNHLHSNFIQIGAERGLPALFVWIVLFVGIGIKAVLRFRCDGGDRAPLAGSLIALCVFQTFGFVEYNFGDSEVLMMLLLIVSFPFVLEKAGDTAPRNPR